MPVTDHTITNLIADAQTHIDAAHDLHLEDGIDTFTAAYREAFHTLRAGLYDIVRSTR